MKHEAYSEVASFHCCPAVPRTSLFTFRSPVSIFYLSIALYLISRAVSRTSVFSSQSHLLKIHLKLCAHVAHVSRQPCTLPRLPCLGVAYRTPVDGSYSAPARSFRIAPRLWSGEHFHARRQPLSGIRSAQLPSTLRHAPSVDRSSLSSLVSRISYTRTLVVPRTRTLVLGLWWPIIKCARVCRE
jgi:hypothetical protein